MFNVDFENQNVAEVIQPMKKKMHMMKWYVFEIDSATFDLLNLGSNWHFDNSVAYRMDQSLAFSTDFDE